MKKLLIILALMTLPLLGYAGEKPIERIPLYPDAKVVKKYPVDSDSGMVYYELSNNMHCIMFLPYKKDKTGGVGCFPNPNKKDKK